MQGLIGGDRVLSFFACRRHNKARWVNWQSALTGLVLLIVAVSLTAQEHIADVIAKATAGDPVAQDALGVSYAMGNRDVPRNYEAALKWFRKSAAQGYTESQMHLGAMYEMGRGVTKDLDEARKWYLLAAKQGNTHAQTKLGITCELGRGVAQDFAEAAKWYRLAAEQGYAEAQYKLGRLYEQGLGVPLNNAEAANWYQKASVQGNREATQALVAMGAK